MKLNDLLLKKEELPILHETCFQIPIHPKLLDENISINPNIAKNIFPKVAEEWTKEIGKNKTPNYDNLIQFSNNGFVTGFQISRDFGGNIYFDKEDSLCKNGIPNRYILFSKEKAKKFEYENLAGRISMVYNYANGNINDYPGALFLRNWAIKYMNEVFKEIF